MQEDRKIIDLYFSFLGVNVKFVYSIPRINVFYATAHKQIEGAGNRKRGDGECNSEI
jgi:hypothetical protein